MNKKAVLGEELLKPIAIALFILIFIFLAIAIGGDLILNSGMFTSTTGASYNYTASNVANLTKAGTSVFDKAPTIMAVIVTVMIITAVVLIVRSVRNNTGGL